jgi:predicted nucleic acid-binding protein
VENMHEGAQKGTEIQIQLTRKVTPKRSNRLKPVTSSTFSNLAAFMKLSGRSPRTRVNDLWIAAQAMENDYALLTANLKDFEGLPGLRASCP